MELYKYAEAEKVRTFHIGAIKLPIVYNSMWGISRIVKQSFGQGRYGALPSWKQAFLAPGDGRDYNQGSSGS